ncbi:MAG: hypothetical protein JRI68_14835 [Deltaproteobacteria bacterium]|nr:hypothetical protein [Deltaproteobacteria bacterium]
MKSSWMAATAALCVLAPGSSFAQPQDQPWPPRTPYDSPPKDIAPPPPPKGGAKGPAGKAADTPYDAPPQDTTAPGKAPGDGAPGAEGEPGSEKKTNEAPPPKISPPAGAAAPPPAPAAPLTALPAPPAPPAEPMAPAGPVHPGGPPGGYGQPQPFQSQLPHPIPFGPEPGPDSADGADWRLIGGLTSAGLGAGMFVVMGVSLARISSIQDEPAFEKYRSGFTPDQSACEQAAADQEAPIGGAATARAADDLCTEANTLEIVSYVSIGAGAALLGLGGYLIFSSDTVTGDSATLRIDPRVGPGHGSLQVSYRF